MVTEQDLTAQERELIASVADQPDEMLVGLLGQLEARESSSYGLTPPSTEEIVNLGKDRLRSFEVKFCCQLRNSPAMKDFLEEDKRISFLERLYTIVVICRGHIEVVDLVVAGTLAARQGVVTFCHNIDCSALTESEN